MGSCQGFHFACQAVQVTGLADSRQVKDPSRTWGRYLDPPTLMGVAELAP
jgi:hypothetical protein